MSGSGSGKTNAILNYKSHQRNFNKLYLYGHCLFPSLNREL